MDSPVGKLMIVQQGEAVKEILFEEKITDAVPLRSTELLLCAQRQLNEYFSGSRKVFSLPLALTGTPFQRKVWQQLTQIPYGEVRSYGQIAQAMSRSLLCSRKQPIMKKQERFSQKIDLGAVPVFVVLF